MLTTRCQDGTLKKDKKKIEKKSKAAAFKLFIGLGSDVAGQLHVYRFPCILGTRDDPRIVLIWDRFDIHADASCRHAALDCMTLQVPYPTRSAIRPSIGTAKRNLAAVAVIIITFEFPGAVCRRSQIMHGTLWVVLVFL